MNSSLSSLILRRGANASKTILSRNNIRTLASEATSIEDIKKTALYDLHVELGGDMVAFAGYQLPVLYKGEDGGVMKEHLHCRTNGKASLFDVSHMGQIRWHGKDRLDFLEKIVVGDIKGLKENSSCLSLITNEKGGIIDDTVITSCKDHVYMVVNGATKHGDMKHFQEQMDAFDGDVTMEYLQDDYSLIALQGPGSSKIVQSILPDGFDLTNMAFMSGADVTLDGIENCRITRCGYTGEDGFELSIPSNQITPIASKLLNIEQVRPTGLGARDSLRLEAGLCLYGNDLNESINPIEAALGWTIGPQGSRRRLERNFLGAQHIINEEGKFKRPTKKRVGIKGMKAPAREHVEIYDSSGMMKIGSITSGTFSPSLKIPIAMGYVDIEQAKVGTAVLVKIRSKMQKAEITKMPFVDSRYYRVPV